MKKNALKRLAEQAKCRLRGIDIHNHEPPDDSNQKFKIIDKRQDEIFYEKVCAMLTENEDIMNPIVTLIDKNLYDNMQETSRQKYFFDVLEKYWECKERFEREHNSTA